VCTCISHWSAIAAALAAFPHAPYVVVLEDDASFELLPLWPGTLRAFLDTLSSQVPAWEMLNLADDASFELLPLWPGTLRAFLDTLSSQVPAWEMLNLAVSNRHKY
ncbi:hypothetical protein T484DRAFT_1777610, partial [Baffinella frigidus]